MGVRDGSGIVALEPLCRGKLKEATPHKCGGDNVIKINMDALIFGDNDPRKKYPRTPKDKGHVFTLIAETKVGEYDENVIRQTYYGAIDAVKLLQRLNH